ncbi:unnamed protein product [Dracunculus medinensis]|uniref:PAP2_C domain-containing protein n=1 Tax=Dracunculus medinensis TaxID=318479 RepID=A0A0N4U2Y1_DRAME|nr:unnamed protein product [Dracunculus medinensis]
MQENVVLQISACFINDLALAWIHERVPTNVPPLPDLWFSFLPEINGAILITECIMIFLLINTFIIIFLHQYKLIVTTRVFFCAALCYTFRALCITILQVPVPSVHTYCAPKLGSDLGIILQRIQKIFWSLGIEQLRSRELCGDLIVSGHTISIFIALCTFKQYAPRRIAFLTYIYTVCAIIASACILLARKHYTFDVLLGYLTATRVFWTYHSLQNSYQKGEFDENALNQSFWSFVIPYIEKDVSPLHPLTNRLIWPFNCSRRSHRYY